MFSSTWLTLIPAYGRDDTTAKAARAAWDAGADWQDAVSGRYVSKSELSPSTQCELRFNNHRGLAVVKGGLQ